MSPYTVIIVNIDVLVTVLTILLVPRQLVLVTEDVLLDGLVLFVRKVILHAYHYEKKNLYLGYMPRLCICTSLRIIVCYVNIVIHTYIYKQIWFKLMQNYIIWYDLMHFVMISTNLISYFKREAVFWRWCKLSCSPLYHLMHAVCSDQKAKSSKIPSSRIEITIWLVNIFSTEHDL